MFLTCFPFVPQLFGRELITHSNAADGEKCSVESVYFLWFISNDHEKQAAADNRITLWRAYK